MVIYLPDIRSCLPTRLEYEALRETYKATVHRLINLPAADEVSIQNGNHKPSTVAPEEPIISISDDDKNININSNNSDNAEPLAAAGVPAQDAAAPESDEVPTGTAETDKALNYIDYKPKQNIILVISLVFVPSNLPFIYLLFLHTLTQLSQLQDFLLIYWLLIYSFWFDFAHQRAWKVVEWWKYFLVLGHSGCLPECECVRVWPPVQTSKVTKLRHNFFSFFFQILI